MPSLSEIRLSDTGSKRLAIEKTPMKERVAALGKVEMGRHESMKRIKAFRG